MWWVQLLGKMKKRSEAMQTLHSGYSKVDHKQTNIQTDWGDYNTLRSLAHSVNMRNFENLCPSYNHL